VLAVVALCRLGLGATAAAAFQSLTAVLPTRAAAPAPPGGSGSGDVTPEALAVCVQALVGAGQAEPVVSWLATHVAFVAAGKPPVATSAALLRAGLAAVVALAGDGAHSVAWPMGASRVRPRACVMPPCVSSSPPPCAWPGMCAWCCLLRVGCACVGVYVCTRGWVCVGRSTRLLHVWKTSGVVCVHRPFPPPQRSPQVRWRCPVPPAPHPRVSSQPAADRRVRFPFPPRIPLCALTPRLPPLACAP
jgi:hypothetical protein